MSAVEEVSEGVIRRCRVIGRDEMENEEEDEEGKQIEKSDISDLVDVSGSAEEEEMVRSV
jgi:hypothetical protein